MEQADKEQWKNAVEAMENLTGALEATLSAMSEGLPVGDMASEVFTERFTDLTDIISEMGTSDKEIGVQSLALCAIIITRVSATCTSLPDVEQLALRDAFAMTMACMDAMLKRGI